MGSSNLFFGLPSRYSSFLPRFYRLASVSIISNMMVPLSGIVDTAFLGHLADIRYLAGVILASILFDYLYRILKFFRNGTNAITAQAVGENDEKGILLALLRSGLIALALSEAHRRYRLYNPNTAISHPKIWFCDSVWLCGC